ncbi:excisionase family DNA-binding protein [Deinococcus peraridilitoris]|uniref:DNA-binding protein, excisionase family n=1 Tax=Deinococcus peraridilitoris (strain DSM 19664 / LMG 22246 / CIP 109416 / KR-200) TaxID=937777 RepID=K9ZZP4_DEIPD|nr:excisionase family DNA-binding protein [Deinococcus peraridilitoris]AFZ66654.1 DNA-binding protein, excisionase family [Deinococcus peraridilitoris DSM 19664]
MAGRKHEPLRLLTVQEAAKLLHVSDDTVRRQIKEGALEAIRVRTTPTGRAQYRIPTAAIDRILGNTALQLHEDVDPFEPLRQAFAHLSDEEREELIDSAVQWAKARRVVPEVQRSPALSEQALRERFAKSPLLQLGRKDEQDER